MHLFSNKSNVEVIYRFLNLLKEKANNLLDIIVNGDCIDASFEILFPFDHSMHCAAAMHDLYPIYLRGNNDLLSHRRTFELKIQDKIFLVMHGDNLDLISRMPKYIRSYQLNKFYNWCKRQLSKNKYSRYIIQKIRLKKKGNFVSSFKDNCFLFLRRKKKYDGIIVGHTHKPEMYKSHDGFWYVNSGCWLKGELPHCIVVTDKQILLCKFALNTLVVKENINVASIS